MKNVLSSPTAHFFRFQTHQSHFPARRKQLTMRFQMNPQTGGLLAEHFLSGVYPRLSVVPPPVPYRSEGRAYYTTSSWPSLLGSENLQRTLHKETSTKLDVDQEDPWALDPWFDEDTISQRFWLFSRSWRLVTFCDQRLSWRWLTTFSTISPVSSRLPAHRAQNRRPVYPRRLYDDFHNVRNLNIQHAVHHSLPASAHDSQAGCPVRQLCWWTIYSLKQQKWAIFVDSQYFYLLQIVQRRYHFIITTIQPTINIAPRTRWWYHPVLYRRLGEFWIWRLP